MPNSQLVSFADQLSAAVREVLRKRGIDVETSVPEYADHEILGEGMKLDFGISSKLSPEEQKEIIQEALGTLGQVGNWILEG
jgi:hypothetical protein